MTVFLDHFLYNDHTISSNLSKHQHNVTTKIQISPQKRSKVSTDQAFLSLDMYFVPGLYQASLFIRISLPLFFHKTFKDMNRD